MSVDGAARVMIFPLITLRCKSAQGAKGKCVCLLGYLFIVKPVGSHVASGASVAIRYEYARSYALIPVPQDAVSKTP